MVNGIMDFEFQDNCVEFLIDKTLDPASAAWPNWHPRLSEKATACSLSSRVH